MARMYQLDENEATWLEPATNIFPGVSPAAIGSSPRELNPTLVTSLHRLRNSPANQSIDSMAHVRADSAERINGRHYVGARES
jgi:hypothetical protein